MGFYELRALVPPLETRQDFDGGNVPVYIGQAKPGTAADEGAWRISKIIYQDGKQVLITWANGSGDFIHKWDDRATYDYNGA